MQVRIVKMREKGVEFDRRMLRDLTGHRGALLVMDVSDQGLRRPSKVARLMQGLDIRHELCDVHIVWCADGRFTLAGFERQSNGAGRYVDYAQSWLCALELDDVTGIDALKKPRNVKPSR